LPGGDFWSEASDVSANGAVVVGFSVSDLGDEAFIWDSTNGMRNLRAVLENDFGLDLAGWILKYARISDNGKVIVGTGINPSGSQEAWKVVLACQSNADCDDANACTDDVCTKGVCSSTPNSATCDDGLYCNGTDTCNSGTCSQHSGDPCFEQPNLICDEILAACVQCIGDADCDDGNECTEDSCSGGSCSNPYSIAGTACGNAAGGDCDDPDTCDGAGVCQANQHADGTTCASDGNDCTSDVCSEGICVHPTTASPVLFVDSLAEGMDDGSSWVDAFTGVQEALSFARQCPGLVDEIWVAAGTYTPAPPNGDRNASFELLSGVGLYGGFAGWETRRDDRDWQENVTTLSGDLSENDDAHSDNNQENSYHVVFAGGTDSTAIFDGFAVVAGNANGDWPRNAGGGMFISFAKPIVSNCRFVGNEAQNSSGMLVYGNGSAPTIANCLFSENTSIENGAGLASFFASSTISNCTSTGNLGRAYAGMYFYESQSIIRNTVVYGNISVLSSAPGFGAFRSDPVVLHSNIEGGWSGCGIGNIDADPMFVAGPDGDFYLSNIGAGQPVDSPCIDAGNGQALDWYITGTTRADSVVDTGPVDMGFHYNAKPTDFDADGDGVPLASDNCPDTANPDQADTDEDGIGNSCDQGIDADGDGVLNDDDNCMLVLNADQADEDADEVGDLCDDCLGSPSGAQVNPSGCAKIHNVSQDSWYGTIQGAIDAAVDGDEIVALAGTYNERINFVGKTIVLRSSNGPALTVIDAESGVDRFGCTVVGPVVSFESGEGSDTALQGFTITGGDAIDGGGVYVDHSSPTISHCRITDNFARGDGGGVFNKGGSLAIRHSTISGNVAIEPGAVGGGISASDGDTLIENCIIVDNASRSGGGIYNARGEMSITQCTLIGNTASVYGALFHHEAFDHPGRPSVVNSIVWGNNPPDISGFGQSNEIRYSAIEGGFPGDGNIAADPLFVDLANRDLRLTECSPCNDSGDNNSVPVDLTEDLDGNPRIHNNTVDMGAYEFQDVGLPPAPLAPEGVIASYLDYCDKIVLSWDEASRAEVYGIFRDDMVFVGPAFESSFVDESSDPGVVHSYFVQSWNVCGTSDYSDEAVGSRGFVAGGNSGFPFGGQVGNQDLVDCLTGPGLVPAPPALSCTDACQYSFDYDGDGDVDLRDFSVYIAGCSIIECDDGVFCNGLRACDAETGTCVDLGEPCSHVESCNEFTDTCEPVVCTVDADCDDGVVCNGTESCNGESGICTLGGYPCTWPETCVEHLGGCILFPTCSEDADCDDGWPCTREWCEVGSFCITDMLGCDDGDPCTLDMCVSDTCANVPLCEDDNSCTIDSCTGGICDFEWIECPEDGLFCNGVESCNPDVGECMPAGDPCPRLTVCNKASDSCDSIQCTIDADCDDGRFCNGIETCAAGICFEGGNPCPTGHICDEEGDACAQLFVVNTGIQMRADKRILAGDDIIAFGTGGFSGVDYMIPSAGDTAGRGIPMGDTFVANGFAVAGKHIALQSNFEVTIYDTATDTSTPIGQNEIRPTNTPVDQYDAGHIQGEGDFFIFRSDSSTDDGLFVKVVDVSGDTPSVISFTNNPGTSAFGVTHVMVDSDTRTAVAVADDTFLVYDIDDPAAAPAEFPIPDGISDTVPHLDGDFIIFEDNLAFGNACILQISTGTITVLTENPSAGQLAIGGDFFGYFLNRDASDSLGNASRSAGGPLSGIPGAMVAPAENFIDGSTANNGAFGYGQTMGITKNGSRWFIAGATDIGDGEYLQVSYGGAFSLFADPTDQDAFGCRATDVSISSNTVAFKAENGPDTVVGYMILDGVAPRLCSVNADCTDFVQCTADVCVAWHCAYVPDDSRCVDDGLWCNGVERCSAYDGCVSTGNPCTSTYACNESTDACEPVACTVDEDCNDGLICTGVEICGADGFCVPGTNPCDDGRFCNGIEICIEAGPVCIEGTIPCDPSSEFCDESSDTCVFDPCYGVTCAAGETCVDGVCVLPALIKTHIVMDENTLIMRPKAGNDLIVWGDTDTVYYVVPSVMDGTETAGTEFPEGVRFAWTHFAVSGKKVLLVTSLGEVRVFDTATGEFRDFPATDIVLKNPQLNDDTLSGLTQASGDYFATLNVDSLAVDGNAVKVIDVSATGSNEWQVISFTIPEENATGVEQVAVDAPSRRVAALDDFGQLWIWSIDDPATAPQQIDMGLNTDLCCVNDSVQMRFEGDMILYQEDPATLPLGLGTTNAVLLNIADGTKTVLTGNPTTHNMPVALAGGSFGYGQWKEHGDGQSGSGMSYRSAIGAVTEAPGATLASQFDTYALRPANFTFDPVTQSDCFDDPKLIGYGSIMTITADGTRWFLSGWGPIDSYLDYLQMSDGGAFTDFADPEQSTLSGGIMATDVSASSNTVAFRALRSVDSGFGCSTNDEWVLGFIVLDRLD